jgi:serine/threonine protein kinase
MTGGCLPRKPVLPKSEFERVTPGLEYLAPEVLCGQMYVACADMYAFALLTLEVANSRFKVFSDVPKYSINSFLELPARTHLQPAVQDLDMNPSVIEKILLCLERDMSKRPDSLKMGEVFKEKPNKSKKIFGIRFSVKKK